MKIDREPCPDSKFAQQFAMSGDKSALIQLVNESEHLCFDPDGTGQVLEILFHDPPYGAVHNRTPRKLQ